MFLLEIDVTSRTYAVNVRNVLDGRSGDYQRIATNYRFRSEQSAVTSLSHYGYFLDYSTGGVGMCQFTVDY